MPRIILEILINADPQVCFDLVRDHRLHETTRTRVTGRGTELGELITFESSFLGVKQRLTVEVVEIERPRIIVDQMRQGVFEKFRHVHEFFSRDGGTLMKDTLEWTLPFGILGKLADILFIERRMTRVVFERNRRLKVLAEKAR